MSDGRDWEFDEKNPVSDSAGEATPDVTEPVAYMDGEIVEGMVLDG